MADETPAAQSQRLRSLQDRWLAAPEVAARLQREGWSARIHGPASPTFAEVYWYVLHDWEEWLAAEVKRMDA